MENLEPSNSNLLWLALIAWFIGRSFSQFFGVGISRSILHSSHLANGPWIKVWTFPTRHAIPKSLKFSHWPSHFEWKYEMTWELPFQQPPPQQTTWPTNFIPIPTKITQRPRHMCLTPFLKPGADHMAVVQDLKFDAWSLQLGWGKCISRSCRKSRLPFLLGLEGIRKFHPYSSCYCGEFTPDNFFVLSFFQAGSKLIGIGLWKRFLKNHTHRHPWDDCIFTYMETIKIKWM